MPLAYTLIIATSLPVSGADKCRDLFTQLVTPIHQTQLSKDEINSLKLYTSGSDSFKAVNFYLRTGRILRGAGWSKRSIEKQASVLTSALNKLPSSAGVFHRFIDAGIKGSSGRFSLDVDLLDVFSTKFVVGEVVTDQAFISTTANDISSGKFDWVTIHMIINGKNAKPIDQFSSYPEQEFIFVPNTRFRVSRVEGQFVKNLATSGPYDQPGVDVWINFVNYFQKFFPGVSANDVSQRVNTPRTNLIPNLVVYVEEL